jgi:hypothetical protein
MYVFKAVGLDAPVVVVGGSFRHQLRLVLQFSVAAGRFLSAIRRDS